MAGITSSDVWRKLKSLLPASIWAKRVEDASGDLGTWDVLLSKDGRMAWIEIKTTAGPEARINLRPGQMAFGHRLVRHGIPGGYLVAAKDGSLRLVGPRTDGRDWRDHLEGRYSVLDEVAVRRILEYLYGSPR